MKKPASTIETLRELYSNLQPRRMKENAPRPGYYLVKSTNQAFIGKHQVRIAQAYWKSSLEEQFNVDFIVEIQLKSFEKLADEGMVTALKGDLKGKIIYVQTASRLECDHSGEFIVEWDFVNEKQEIGIETEDDHDQLQIVGDIEQAQDAEMALQSLIDAFTAQNDDVFNAILIMEDMQYEELDQENEWIFGLLAQDLPVQIATS